MSAFGGQRASTLLIAALGGEGGGVLADWVVETAHAAGLPVQATSIPGVAQRTGATTYYIEIFPVRRAELGGRMPVLCLAPTAGQVDVFVGSELMEAARQAQAGMISGRTTCIASTHRVYATAEKMAMGDGRFDSVGAIKALHTLTRRAILFNMEAETIRAGTVISAVMFGALVGAGALPLERTAAEAAIRAGGKGAEASLRGFAAGFALASGEAGSAPPAQTQAQAPAPVATAEIDAALRARIDARIAPAAQAFALLGAARCVDYLDSAYAALYLDRLGAVAARDAAPHALSVEAARYLALWMCYEDVARVADLKSRLSRFDGIRSEAAAQADQPIKVVEFFKPGYGEIADQLPPALADRVRAWAKKRGKVAIFENGIHVESTSLFGYAKLRAMAALRRIRRASSRYLLEQAQIERWVAAMVKAPNLELAHEVALCARLIKGYSDTHQRGKENFLRIMDSLVEGGDYSPETRLAYVGAARQAALADPEGRKLDGSLEAAGIAPRPLKAQTVHFYPRKLEH